MAPVWKGSVLHNAIWRLAMTGCATLYTVKCQIVRLSGGDRGASGNVGRLYTFNRNASEQAFLYVTTPVAATVWKHAKTCRLAD